MINIVGNSKGIKQIEQWIKKPTKHLFISGPCGIGKTTIIKNLLQNTKYNTYYIDDTQIKDTSNIRFYEQNTVHEMLHGRKIKNIIIIDDVSEYKVEYGEWLKVKVPVIFISDDTYNKKLSIIKSKCRLIRLYKPYPAEIHTFICNSMLPFDSDYAINNLIEHINGDIRQLINILHDLEGCTKITEKRLERYLLLHGKKDINENIFNLTNELFNGVSMNEALNIYNFDNHILPHAVFINYNILWTYHIIAC